MSEPIEVLKKIRMDLTNAQAKVTEAINILSTLNLPDTTRPTCRCGLSFKHSSALAEHVYHAHDGPEPAHWKRAEEMST